ncbi:peroxiredoxin [Pseudoclavibacter endophyticus]|uniref:thioredoxin-dependent peroxiredoxin n=2 Tax=Pseudoclavibacter endophyticus TaxID=1778590 RepID=A0A6H9WUV2_9MICO|nr:peroxiredoxin [Pseudoclavibacter endophyticus]
MQPGERAPDFELPTSDGQKIGLAGLRGRRVILFTYPEAFTPGCTGEACDFRDAYADLRDAGYTLLGISSDSPERNAAFAAEHGLTFPILSDVDHAVQSTYGAYGMRNKYGNWKVGPIRSTFVIDAQGTLEHVFPNVVAKGHVGRVRKALGLA